MAFPTGRNPGPSFPQFSSVSTSFLTLSATALTAVRALHTVGLNRDFNVELNADLRYDANQEIDGKAEYLGATVQPDGKFNVSIGSNGLEKECDRQRECSWVNLR